MSALSISEFAKAEFVGRELSSSDPISEAYKKVDFALTLFFYYLLLLLDLKKYQTVYSQSFMKGLKFYFYDILKYIV